MAMLAAAVMSGGALADHSDLSGEWHLDSLSGGTTPDSSGHGLNGAQAGSPTVVAGRFGNALEFPTEGDYVNAGDHAVLQPGTLSAMAWVKSATVPTTVKGIVSQGANGSCSFSSYALYTGGSAAPDVGTRFYVHTAGGNARTTAVNDAAVWDGQWHLLTGTFDGTNVRIYVDGQEAGSGTSPGGSIAYGLALNNDFIIGGLLDPACTEQTNFTGAIDEARVYNRALTPEEIAYLSRGDHTSPPELPIPGSPPPTPPPPPEKNLTVPRVIKMGNVAGVKDTVRYRCSDGTWSGLAADNRFVYTWYNDDGIHMSDGQLFPPIKAGSGQTFDVGPSRAGRKYFCTVTAIMNSRQRLNASSTKVVVSNLSVIDLTILEEQPVGNFGVRGIDVFQVTQPNSGAQMFSFATTPRLGGFERYCGAGVPSNRNYDNCATFVGPRQEANYDGVHMDRLKPTTAVVYVDRDVVVSGAEDIEVQLRAGNQGGPLFIDTLRQTIHPPVALSPFVSFAEREQEAYGVSFNLPQDWLSQAAFSSLRSLRLEATVRLPTSAYPKIECSITESCRDDDTFKLSGVDVRRNFYPLRVRTIQIIKPDQQPGQPNAITLAAPDQVLKGVTDLFPGGSGFEISPYAATLQVPIDSFTATSANCPAPATAETAIQTQRRVRGCRSGAVFAALTTYRASAGNTTGYDLLVGAHRYTYPSATGGTFTEPGTSRGSITSDTAAGGQPMLHLNDGSVSRPLTAAGHEFGHALGALHSDFLQAASSMNSCGGNDNGQVGEAWPPDNRGRLQGVKFDPATGNRFVDTATTAWYDLMSYCSTNDTDAWLSPRNFNQFENRVTLLAEKNPKTRAHPTAVAAQAGAGLITGTLIGGQARITAILPAAAGIVAPPADPGSPVRIQAYDAAGRALPEVGAKVELLTNHDGSATFIAPLPAGAARVEVKANGAVLDQRTATRRPTVRVTAPRPGSRARRNLLVRWSAADPDRDPLVATVQFAARPGAAFRTVFQGPSTGSATVPAAMLQFARSARVRVIVNDGFNIASAISGAFRADGSPPQARIVLPTARSAATAATRTLLVGQGVDDARRQLRGRSLTWFAGRRRLGTGSSLRVRLRAGRVTVRLVARDAQGRVASAQRSLTVSPVPLEIASLRTSPTVSRTTRTLAVKIATTTSAIMRAGGRSFNVGTRARTFAVRLPSRPRSGVLRVPLRITARGPRQRAITTTLIIYRR
jgi:hypothetical protein